MADITRFLFLRHLRADSTSHVRHIRNGKVVHDGAGVAFWYRSRAAALSQIPIDDREQPLLFHGRTLDFQDVTVQANVTYRVIDPAVAAGRVDFGIDPHRGTWSTTPLEQIGGLLTELAQQHALDRLAGMPLTQALAEGMTAVRERVAEGLSADQRLTDTGLGVVDVRVIAIKAEPEVERALQTPTREQIQQEADRATYERRALAVERERAIAENELQNKIELARREEELVARQGQNERKRAGQQAAAQAIETDARAERQGVLANAEAAANRVKGAAAAEVETARVAAYRDVAPAALALLAAQELAGNVPEIGTLTLTPDLLTPILARLGAGQAVGSGQDVGTGPDAAAGQR